ncbi:MAG: AcvB/VirJ family lysyl-phosphatidylglycerol hydrolase [Prolixibacteraceae bacterium]
MSKFCLFLIFWVGLYLHSTGKPISKYSNFLAGTTFRNEMPGLSYSAVLKGDLPLQIFGTSVESDLPMFVYITGDGGWNNFSSALCSDLNHMGVPVIALDAQKYFWKIKSPEETAADLAVVIVKYQKEWKKERFVFAGFSFGADIVPFLINRFPASLGAGLVSSILISPDKTCDFEIHWSDMLSMGISKGKYDVIKEIQESPFKKFAVVLGSEESLTTRQVFQSTNARVEILQGNHHFDSDHDTVAKLILNVMKNPAIR